MKLIKIKEGDVFGAWLVIREEKTLINNKNYVYMWCRCSCGHEQKLRKDQLISGKSTKCASCSRQESHNKQFNLHKIDVGTKFNRWTVVNENPVSHNRVSRGKSIPEWFLSCQCDCGLIKEVSRYKLIKGTSRMCKSCSRKYSEYDGTTIDDGFEVGHKFGRWTLIDNEMIRIDRIPHYKVKCECGYEDIKHRDNLIRGYSTQCPSCASEASKTHGLSDSRIYHILYGMHSRCYKPNTLGYDHYGGRNIKVAFEWNLNDNPKNAFINFYQWSVENGYDEDLQIDRIDVNGDYSSSNTRWVTSQQNSWNKRGCPKIRLSKYKGVKKSRGGRWSAGITKDYVGYHLGTFDTEEEAALAYNEKAKEFFGEHACLNKIEENDTEGPLRSSI